MLLIDGDIVAYRVACAVGDDAEPAYAQAICNSFMAIHCLAPFGEATPYQVYLTGKGNFRNAIAVTAPYKGSRKDKPRPLLLPIVRNHLVDVWGATVCDGIEADDAIATAASQDLDGSIILSLDKDFDQVACRRYNFVTGETTHPTPEEAMKTLYKQILTGDMTDNIVGMEGCGPAMASELIDGCTKELDMQLICIDQMGVDRAEENGHLVYLRRATEFDSFNMELAHRFDLEVV